MGQQAAKYTPFLNYLLKSIGRIDISRKSLINAIKNNERIGIVPGGIAEIF